MSLIVISMREVAGGKHAHVGKMILGIGFFEDPGGLNRGRNPSVKNFPHDGRVVHYWVICQFYLLKLLFECRVRFFKVVEILFDLRQKSSMFVLHELKLSELFLFTRFTRIFRVINGAHKL